MRAPRAFTLIELLIVVAIIAILAAIAVPNFTESQMRSKVARSRNDMRAIATALEAYRVDTNRYPPCGFNFDGGTGLSYVTSPIAYIVSDNVRDIFRGKATNTAGEPLPYINYASRDHELFSYWDRAANVFVGRNAQMWFAFSAGPDLQPESEVFRTVIETDNLPGFVNTLYDPTNGVISYGNLYRAGGNFHGPGATAARIAGNGG
jgi:prepilin-type N-terminal cleavage/methylation domain-containing protein